MNINGQLNINIFDYSFWTILVEYVHLLTVRYSEGREIIVVRGKSWYTIKEFNPIRRGIKKSSGLQLCP